MSHVSRTTFRAAYDALELARVTYRAAVLDAVRTIVRENVAGNLDETLRLVHWLTNDSPLTYDAAGELEESLADFPEHAHDAVRNVIVRLRAFGAAADAMRDLRPTR
jgi:hypothetical protein